MLYTQAGLDQKNAFNMSLVQCMSLTCFRQEDAYAVSADVIGGVGTVASWLLVRRFGRRTLYIAGLTAMGVLLFTMGILGFTTSRLDHAASWGVASVLLVYSFVFNLTVGPVCFAVVAEVPSTRLRNKTVVIARNVYNLVGIGANVVVPLQMRCACPCASGSTLG